MKAPRVGGNASGEPIEFAFDGKGGETAEQQSGDDQGEGSANLCEFTLHHKVGLGGAYPKSFFVEFPPAFVEGVLREKGEAWLAAVPGQLAHYAGLWGLQSAGPPWHGYLGLAFPMVRDGVPVVLKLTRVDEETRDEASALRHWDGQGVVRLLEADPGVLLLERLDASRTLGLLPLAEAVSLAAKLLRRLAVPAPDGFLDMKGYGGRLERLAHLRWERFRPFPLEWLRCPEVRQDLLVNQDLHFENVLAGQREAWLVIDPKPLRGDPEFGVAPLLWNRFQEGPVLARLEQVVVQAELDRALAREWSLFRVLEYWLWALDRGLTEDPARCRDLASALVQA